MSVFEIKPVRREQAKIVLGLAAPSGEGKTYTALLIALGLAGGDPTKVCLLDTENRRGSLYSDIYEREYGIKERFRICDFAPPHSPARYVLALRAIADRGMEAVVIDSTSHEHEGQGGLEEIAHSLKANGEPRLIPDWITAKREHKKFMNALLYLPAHVICCFRAREKTDFKNPKQPVNLGLQPICEKNVLFDMTASFMLHSQGKEREIIKLPENLREILGGKGYLNRDHGKLLREWCGESDPMEIARNVLRLAATEGTEQLKAAWESIGKDARKDLADFKTTLKDTAEHADNALPGLEEPPAGGPPSKPAPVDPNAPDIPF